MAIVLEAKKGALTAEFKAKKYARINIHGVINRELTDQVIKQIEDAIEVSDASETPNTPTKIIFIFLHSNGGSVYEMSRIVEAINRAKRYNIVATVVDSIAFSAAAPIFCCGDDGFRFVAENAHIMIHHAILRETSGGGGAGGGGRGSSTDTLISAATAVAHAASSSADSQCVAPSLSLSSAPSAADLQHLQDMQKRLEKLITAIYTKNKSAMFTKFMNDLEKHRHVDWFLSAKELVRYGIANYIGVPDFVHDFTYTPKLLLKGKKPIAIPLAARTTKARVWSTGK